MSEMVERVARALFTKRMPPFSSDADTDMAWNDKSFAATARRIGAHEDARAAIAAMREPTEAMIEAHISECAGDADEAGPKRVKTAYQAMIDEALK